MKKFLVLYQRIYQDQYWFTIPNILSLLRIGLAPILVLSMYAGLLKCAFLIVVFASITDLLDGFLARSYKSITNLGILLDPLADKLFLLMTFGSLALVESPLFRVPIWFLTIVFVREIIMVIGVVLVLWLNNAARIAPSIWGKMTTFFQLLFILWLFGSYFFGIAPNYPYEVLLRLLALFSLFSLGTYIRMGIKYVFGY
jgi:cardiolipin synthase